MPGRSKTYLSGGGNFDKTKIIDLHFIESLRLSGNLNVLFIPIAKNTDQDGFCNCLEWLRNKLNLLNASDINISMETDLNKCIDLEKFGAVYIGGGNTYKLQKLINDSNLNNRLIKYIYCGGITYGASAGAVIMGKNIAIYQEENENDYNVESGMSLCKNYSIRCHYIKNQDDEKIWNFVFRYKIPVIALSLGSAIFVLGNISTLIGEASAYVFNIDQTINEVKIGSNL